MFYNWILYTIGICTKQLKPVVASSQCLRKSLWLCCWSGMLLPDIEKSWVQFGSWSLKELNNCCHGLDFLLTTSQQRQADHHTLLPIACGAWKWAPQCLAFLSNENHAVVWKSKMGLKNWSGHFASICLNPWRHPLGGWLLLIFFLDLDMVFIFIIFSHVFTWKSKNALSPEGAAGCQSQKICQRLVRVLRVVPKVLCTPTKCNL